MKNILFSRLLTVIFILFGVLPLHAQCVNLLHPSTDSTVWARGWSNASNHGFYSNDTLVLNRSAYSENDYVYSTVPSTMFGTASTFSASFDFRIDQNSACSDGLTFWFFTSSLYGLGSSSKEGGQLGFPDTVSGFALAFRTIGCVDEIYMKKINNNHYSWSGGSGVDTNICPKLMSQTFLTDSQWHHCIVNYNHGYITATFDGNRVSMSGYSPIFGTGHFGFMATNGGGYSRKCLKNIQICAGLGTPTFGDSTFGSYINRQCNGPQITTQTATYSSTNYVKTYYGDGSHDSTYFLPGMTGGYLMLTHNYTAPGNYTIIQQLFDGTSLIKTLRFSYENIFCATLPVKLFFDTNADGLFEPGEPPLSKAVLVEVDSNGISIDTVSATSGFYYTAYGHIGDVYSFKVIPSSGISTGVPVSGIIYDSIVSGILIYPIKYFGMTCVTGSSFDLSVNSIIPVTGVRDQWGNIYVQNAYCAPITGTLTMHFSPKYAGAVSQVTPTPASVSANSITWNLTALSATDPAPVQLHYQANYLSTALTIGDTVHSWFSIDGGSGDVNTGNNQQVIIDTVKAGCDPNEMWVTPVCLASGAAPHWLQFKINFENTGNDTAHNIYVLDTLSPNLDISTFELAMTTNEMYVSRYKDIAGNNILKFDFPNINLLDSSHHGLCDGGLIYNIKTKAALPDGSYINGRAGIYFDVNDVVLTNIAASAIGNCIAENESVHATSIGKINVYPNPANSDLHIDNVVLPATYRLLSLLGNTLYQGKLENENNTLTLSNLPSGIYILEVNNGVDRKIIKITRQ